MASLAGFKRRFTPNWWMTILAVLFIGLFIRLGCWQLERSHEKNEILINEQAMATKAPKAWSPTMKRPANYQRVTIQGQYIGPDLLLDNQHHKHQLGYNVITPLQLENGELVLVDRGWVAGDKLRKQLPKYKTPMNNQSIAGYVYYPPEKRVTLGQMIDKSTDKQVVIEWVDTKELSHFLQKTVYPFIIRLDEQVEHGFVRDWPLVSMPPQRHLGYAVQWFAMAFVLLVIWIALSVKKSQ
jgi:surfeit locus 1 family protein